MGCNPMTSVLRRGGKFGHTGSQRRGLCEDRGRDEVTLPQPGNTKDDGQPPSAGRVKEGISLEPLRGA